METFKDPVAILAAALTRHYGHVAPTAPDTWSPPLRVLDAALAVDLEADAIRLHRPIYQAEVVVPVEGFRRAHPEVRTLADLRALVLSYPDPAAFVRSELGPADGRRGEIVLGLLDHLLAKLDQWADVLDGATESERLAALLGPAFSGGFDVYDVGVASFRDAGYDYLRMRLGAPVVVPELPVYCFADEVLGQDLNAPERVGEAIRVASLSPLTVLQAIREDRARGRAWRVGPPGDSPDAPHEEAWVAFFKALLAVMEEREPDRLGERLGPLHRDAPHAPPGAAEALRGDHVAAGNALRRRRAPRPGFAALADEFLIALHSQANGYAMDAEVELAVAHGTTAQMIRALQAAEEPAAADVMRCLHALVEQSATRIPSWDRETL